MTITRSLTLALIAFTAFSLGCLKGGISATAYHSEADKFSIEFPGGKDLVETGSKAARYAESSSSHKKSLDNKSENFRSYEVEVSKLSSSHSGKSAREKQLIALNGWDKEPGTVVKDIKVNGQSGIDSLRTVEIGPVKMSFREVVFGSEDKLYVVKVSASKKENTTAPEAEAFINSFRLD